MIKGRAILVNNVGYLLVWKPEHPRADKSGAYEGYVYEHLLVAEKSIGRSIRQKEEVHHLDTNKVNNSPINLLVLEKEQHAKLHSWLDKIEIDVPRAFTYKSNQDIDEVLRQCKRCRVCKLPISTEAYCSKKCEAKKKRFIKSGKKKRPSKKRLLSLLKRKSWVAIGKRYGVSDNAVRKWAKAYKIDVSKFKRGKMLD